MSRDGGRTNDVLVIGGGIAGMSAAWRLAAAGAGSACWRPNHSSATTAPPGLRPRFTAAYGNAAVRRLTADSRAFLEAPPPGFTESALLRPRGCMTVAGPADVALLDAELARSGEVHAIDPAEALRLVPVLRADAVAAAILEPACRDIDADALFNGYRRAFLAAGGQVVTGARVERIGRDGAAWWVESAAGRHAGATLVNAAGAWADAVARCAGVRPAGLVAKRRTAITVDAPGCAEWPMVVEATETLYFKPDAGRLMVSPADETPVEAYDAQAEEMDVAVAMDRLQRATTLDIRRVSHRWAGLRTFAADHAPVVGEDPDVPGFIWLAGQGGCGVMTSPALSAVAAAAVAGQAHRRPSWTPAG